MFFISICKLFTIVSINLSKYPGSSFIINSGWFKVSKFDKELILEFSKFLCSSDSDQEFGGFGEINAKTSSIFITKGLVFRDDQGIAASIVPTYPHSS